MTFLREIRSHRKSHLGVYFGVSLNDANGLFLTIATGEI